MTRRGVAFAVTRRREARSRVCVLTRVPAALIASVTRDLRKPTFVSFDFALDGGFDATFDSRNASEAALGLPAWNATVAMCDLLLISLEHASVQSQQGLLLGLSSLLRLARSSPRKNGIVMMGPDCLSPDYLHPRYRIGGACMRKVDPLSPVPADAERRGNYERYPCDAELSCWLDKWRELHEQREQLRKPSCKSDFGGRMVCIAAIDTSPSLCEQEAPLLSGVPAELVSWLPRDPAWQPNRKWKTSVTRRLQLHLRYLTALPCGERICLVFKNAFFETYIAAISSDDGLTFDSAPQLVMPRERPVAPKWLASGERFVTKAVTTHNLAIAYVDGEYLFVGGRYRPIASVPKRGKGPPVEPERGIWMSRSASLGYSEDAQLLPGTRLRINPNLHHGAGLERVPDAAGAASSSSNASLPPPRLRILGEHAGCVERRSAASLQWAGVPPGACEFDGRLSVARFRGRYWLFARANLATSGQRFVQAASSTDLETWSPFQLLTLKGYTPKHGDVYYFAVQPNPADPEKSLIAIFPLVHRGRACACVSFSADALSWSTPRPLVNCQAAGERAVDQPAVGVVRRGDKVLLYVHENVPQVRIDARTAEVFRSHLGSKAVREGLKPRIVRYAIDVAELRRWTRDALS